MGKNLLLDTDILIDWLHGRPWARDLLTLPGYRFYYSSVTQKELLSKPGLSATERKRIAWLLAHLRWVPVSAEIALKTSELVRHYGKRGLAKHDAIVAATAWAKGLILLTRNRRHFDFVREIELLKI